MTRLRFEKQNKKKKTWIFPLIVIVLLYISIPIILMNKGSVSVEKSFELLKKDSILVPVNEYFAGIAFYETASVFPGFTKWANKKINQSNQKMIDIHKTKSYLLKKSIYEELSMDNITKSDSVIIKIDDNIKTILINKQNKEFVISDSLSLLYQTQFCEKWKKVFNKAEVKKSINCEICN